MAWWRLSYVGALGIVCTLLAISSVSAGGFERGIVLQVDGEEYYLAGAPDAPDGATDIPGHYWVRAGKRQAVGKHYNTGPFGAPNWWSSDAPDGDLLYMVHGYIDEWTIENAEAYASRGYVHYHELVSVIDGSLHPNKVVWLRHTALSFFTLDGGPAPQFAHSVTPGVDYEFINNYFVPYEP
jgi:selenium-binding protein 1